MSKISLTNLIQRIPEPLPLSLLLLPLLGMDQLPARDLLRHTLPLMIAGSLFMMAALLLRTL